MPKATGKEQHEILVRLIEDQFPKLRPGQRRYIQNKASQVLRRCEGSYTPYRLQNTSWPMIHGGIDHSFKVGNATVWFALIAD